MKLSFEPKENVSWLDYYIFSRLPRLSDFFFCKELFKNWRDVVFFRMGLKKKIILETRNNEKVTINNFKDYENFWREFWEGNRISLSFLRTLKNLSN